MYTLPGQHMAVQIRPIALAQVECNTGGDWERGDVVAHDHVEAGCVAPYQARAAAVVPTECSTAGAGPFVGLSCWCWARLWFARVC